MKQGYYRTGNLNACMKRLVNQYHIINVEHDYNDDANSAATKGSYNSRWPHGIGDAFGTVLELDEQDGDYVFNIQLTQEQVDSMPKSDNPNFTFQYEGELDEQGEPLPLPTYMVEDRDAEGLPIGTFTPRDICVMK